MFVLWIIDKEKAIQNYMESVEENGKKSANIADINSFKWVQMFNNSRGKPSAMLVVGFAACIVAVSVFAFTSILMLYIVFTKYSSSLAAEIQSTQMQSVALFALGGTMLGVRRFTNDKKLEINGESSQ